MSTNISRIGRRKNGGRAMATLVSFSTYFVSI